MTANDLKRARTVAHSWMIAWGLDSSTSVPGVDLVVEGQRVDTGSSTEPTDIQLNPEKLASQDFLQTMDELWCLTDLLGYGCPDTPRMPPGSERTSHTDYEGSSMRLRPFGKTANPPEELIQKYLPIVKKAARKAAHQYYRTLDLMAQGVEDLETIGMVYLVLYLHRHQDLDNEERSRADLSLFLRQEYARWAAVTNKKLQNITEVNGADPEDSAGTPIIGAALERAVEVSDPPETIMGYSYDPCYREPREPVEEVVSRKTLSVRRKAAAARLAEKLAALPHEQFVSEVTRVMNGGYDGDVVHLANRIFNAHKKGCDCCRCADEAWTEYRKKRFQRKPSYRGRK